VSPGRWLSALLLAFALAAGVGLWLQHETTAALQNEIALLRDEQKTLARLRAENQRLSAAQVPEAELARLRADRAALVRLRDEIDRLKARVEQRASTEQPMPKSAKAGPPATPALTLSIALDPNGNLLRDGAPVDLNFEIRQRLAGLRRGDFVKIRFDVPDAPQVGFMKQRVNELMTLAKEFGLRAEVVFESAAR
jgi:hypothetical protein